MGVVEVRVPVVIIVDRVVDAAFVLAAEAEVERGDAEVVEENRVIGARSQGADPEVGPLARLLAILRRCGSRDAPQLQPLPDGELLLRVRDVAGDPVDELLQRVRSLSAEIAPAVRVRIDVDGGVGMRRPTYR